MKVKIRLVNSILIAILVCKLLSPERGQLSGLTFSVFLKASGPLACLKKKRKMLQACLWKIAGVGMLTAPLSAVTTHCKCNWC